MTMTGCLTRILVLASICLGSFGCGRGDIPELGTVAGKVTMDGKPLAGVMVQFHSAAGGRPGSGTTASDGTYELLYTAGAKGTKLGPSKIEITTVWPDGEPKPGEKETIPAKYNSESELKEEVKKGRNQLNFELKSEPAATN